MTGSKTNALKFSSAHHVLKFCSGVSAAAPHREMGKKSKRRGGGSGKKSDECGRGDQSLLSQEALLEVQTPISWRGIFSTNDEPTCCVFCGSFLLTGYTSSKCCGKICCDNCKVVGMNSPEFTGSRFLSLDLRGKRRCVLCNALGSKRSSIPILRREAELGKTWAQFVLAHYLRSTDAPEDALFWFKRAACGGHPDAFMSLSKMYREGGVVDRITLTLTLTSIFPVPLREKPGVSTLTMVSGAIKCSSKLPCRTRIKATRKRQWPSFLTSQMRPTKTPLT